jgi:hypothetical protein
LQAAKTLARACRIAGILHCSRTGRSHAEGKRHVARTLFSEGHSRNSQDFVGVCQGVLILEFDAEQ